MKNKLYVGTLLASAIVVGTAAADEVALDISYGGSGCGKDAPVSGAMIDIDENGLADRLILKFSSYRNLPGERRTTCSLRVDPSDRVGWQFAINRVRYFGQVNFPEDVSGDLESMIFFPTATNFVTLQGSLTGPIEGRYVLGDDLSKDQLVWSPCDTNKRIAINTSINLGGNISDLAWLRSGAQVYSLVWRKCE